MANEPIDDIALWSAKLSAWRQDCLRRLAVSNDLSESDLGELISLVKSAAGLPLEKPAPIPQPFQKSHFGGGKPVGIKLKGMSNVQNVNRLAPDASLSFCPNQLTVIYGRNGSGKSGFVRILRTACRTRVEDSAKLRVLGDVYGGNTGPQSADILIESAGADGTIAWTPGMAAAPALAQVAVFDTASAQLYVDSGNQIRYLPFGLALPHRLNSANLVLKERLEAERAKVVGDKVALTAIAFATVRPTTPQKFAQGVTKTTAVEAIDAAATFTAKDQERLDEVSQVLAAGAAAVADISALATWSSMLAKEIAEADGALSDPGLAAFQDLKGKASAAREAAQSVAGVMFTDEPLPGVGSETWRAMWKAARDYSVGEAYKGMDFPVIATEGGAAACVLCQQPLDAAGADRMSRFRAYMDDALGNAAVAAEKAVSDARVALPELKLQNAADYADRTEQVRKRDETLAAALTAFRDAALARRLAALARLDGNECDPAPAMTSPLDALNSLTTKLGEEKIALSNAGDEEERAKLVTEKAELEDRKILAANREKLLTRRELLKTDAAYAVALAEVQSTGVTKRANELVDAHLTKAVVDRFTAERDNLDISHLKVGLTRKSGKTKAEFGVDPQTKLTKLTSEILSEGEQRALALAGFLTEVALTDGSGAIVVDDPVSSLDRERCLRVAQRLAEESQQRQVIVFTHDIIFFNELCQAADSLGIEPVTTALYSDKKLAGRIDAVGVSWKGAKVAKRVARIKDAFAPLPKLHATSPATYEMAVKNLYGRLRDTYERIVEELIFCEIVQRGVDVVQTQKLRMVHLSHALALRFHEGMTKANTHSHDNPAADTVAVPEPSEFLADIAFVEELIKDLKTESQATEAARPQMGKKG